MKVTYSDHLTTDGCTTPHGIKSKAGAVNRHFALTKQQHKNHHNSETYNTTELLVA